VLFIMPHCELELYDAVLAANWDAERLTTIAILGNSFSDYVERNPSRTRKLGKHVSLIQQCTRGAPSPLVQCRPRPHTMADTTDTPQNTKWWPRASTQFLHSTTCRFTSSLFRHVHCPPMLVKEVPQYIRLKN
jgi:hypothetical protein